MNKTIYFKLKNFWCANSHIITSMGTENFEIKSFCETCFNDWKACNFTTPLLKICKDINKNSEFDYFIELFSMIKNNETFKSAYEEMCGELFQYGAKPQYIVSLIAFSLQLDSHMQKMCTWYQTEMLISLITTILQKMEFVPSNFVYNNNKTWREYCYDSLLILVPVFFFCYYCYKSQ